MNKGKNKFLTSSQLITILVGTLIGTEILRLPNKIIHISKQDAWISIILGALYPLYILLVGNYIIKKYPNENILSLSKKFFGNLIGNILNFIFFLQFLLYCSNIIGSLIKTLRVYLINFLSPIKVALIAIFLSIYLSNKGLKVLAKINELIFCLTLILLLLSTAALKNGTILNIKPIFGSGFLNILSASKYTGYSYTSFEILFLIHPFIKETKNIKKDSLKALLIVIIMYTWVAFSIIFYLGIDLAPKSYWPFVLVTESIHIPIINNFRYVFMFLWTLIMFKSTSNFYWATTFILNDITKIKKKKLIIYLSPIILYLALQNVTNVTFINSFNSIVYIFIIFNIIFISLISLISYKKSKIVIN